MPRSRCPPPAYRNMQDHKQKRRVYNRHNGSREN
ncbi:unnamed protein product [Haemonchus placei]|uniref:Uncharacterized protein n=1 Tax=Haemonchus placei TaxID=6290 RepID=A0A0N4WPZ9_HAEPC|nr:unnamed protein product [Haemonchus placei]